MSVLPAVVVTTGVTPPGQYTGMVVPDASLKVSIPTLILPAGLRNSNCK